jgi:hypothetical protein
MKHRVYLLLKSIDLYVCCRKLEGSIEAPKTPRGVGCGRDIRPCPLGEGRSPSPRKFVIFDMEMLRFDGLIMGVIIT